jgi:hypothetical protein
VKVFVRVHREFEADDAVEVVARGSAGKRGDGRGVPTAATGSYHPVMR